MDKLLLAMPQFFQLLRWQEPQHRPTKLLCSHHTWPRELPREPVILTGNRATSHGSATAGTPATSKRLDSKTSPLASRLTGHKMEAVQ
jgi:hypothetical protein